MHETLTEKQYKKWRQKAGQLHKDYKKIYKKEDLLANEMANFYGLFFDDVADWVTELSQAETDEEYSAIFKRFEIDAEKLKKGRLWMY